MSASAVHGAESASAHVAPDLTGRAIPDLISLAGRTAAVTGGARGIGAAIVERLAEAGASVLVGDVDEAAAISLADRLAESRPQERRVWGVRVDVAHGGSVQALAAQAVARTGSLDIWVNAAGIYPKRLLLELDDEFWDRMLDVNLRGAMTGSREAARAMVAGGRGGVIINIASITGFRAVNAGAIAYVASKHGVVGLTKSLAVELGAHGIRALAVAPAAVMTPGMRAIGEASDVGAEAFHARLIERVQLGRVGAPDDVARVVLFCVSDLAAFMTGSTVHVDGGDLAL